MERDPVVQGNPIQKSARNKVRMNLFLTQMKMLMLSGCDENLAHHILYQVNQRMRKIKEYRDAAGKLSKSQQDQLAKLETSIALYTSGMMPTENLVDLIKQQDRLTMDLAEKVMVTGKHSKRSKRVRIGKLEPGTRSVLRKYMTASRKIFNTALDLHNKGFRAEEIRKRCVRSKFVS